MDETLIAGRYEIRDLLCRGAGGTVLAAMDRLLGRLVAVKLIRRPGLDDPAAIDALHRALQDAQIAGRLSHPAILAVHETGKCPDYAWVAQELVQGETLQAAIDRDGPQPLAEVARIMDELLGGLGAAHARGIVHGDLKAGTIMLAAHQGAGMADAPRLGLGRVKLGDFGIARLVQAGPAVNGPAAGLPAPEHLRGEAIDHRADIWAAGILLHQLLTAERPWEGAPVALLQAILECEPPAASRRCQGLPPMLDGVVARALAKQPADRFQTVADMADAIRVAVMPATLPALRRTHPQGLIGFLRRKRA